MKKIHPFYWSSLILIISQAACLLVASRVHTFVEVNDIVVPEMNLGLPIAYFLSAVVIIGLVLFFIPMSKLKIVFRVLFLLLFIWGLFVDLSFFLPPLAAILISAGAAAVWFFWPKLWLHDLLLTATLAGVGAVFGYMFSPWTAIIFMVVLSVYDILAVRFGYMMWMAKKLSQLDTLPAFLIPKDSTGWNMDVREVRLLDDESSERNFSLLGGGDIGFPLILTTTVFYAYGFSSSLILAGFTILGLVSVYVIQRIFLQGKAMAALPPMTFAGILGFLVVYFII